MIGSRLFRLDAPAQPFYTLAMIRLQCMLRGLLLVFVAQGVVLAQEKQKPWEEAALNAVKAINSGNADLFLAWSHPQEQERLKSKFMEKVLTPTPGVTPEAQLRTYGLRSVEQLSRMPAAAFAAVAIAQDYAANDAVTRQAMARATFRILASEKIAEDHFRVRMALHVPLEEQPLDRELVANVVRTEEGWRYNGLE
jgi:hypothetical protein